VRNYSSNAWCFIFFLKALRVSGSMVLWQIAIGQACWYYAECCLSQSLSEQEQDKTFIEDVAFLFWKYFRVDITICPYCGVGHVSIIKGYIEGG